MLSTVVGQLSLLRGSLEHVVGPLGAAAAPAWAGTSSHSEGAASAAWVHAPPTTTPVRPLHLSLTVTVIVLHRHRERCQAFKMKTGSKSKSLVCV